MLLDILMGNDSPLYIENSDKNKIKRQDIPQFQAFPLIQMVYSLMVNKKNLRDTINPV